MHPNLEKMNLFYNFITCNSLRSVLILFCYLCLHIQSSITKQDVMWLPCYVPFCKNNYLNASYIFLTELLQHNISGSCIKWWYCHSHLAILMAGYYKVLKWSSLEWHDVYKNFIKICQLIQKILEGQTRRHVLMLIINLSFLIK